MNELRRLAKVATGLHGSIGADLDAFGGVHRCNECGYEILMKPGDAAYYLRHGWPRHCGQGMRWVTDRELAEEAAADDGEEA